MSRIDRWISVCAGIAIILALAPPAAAADETGSVLLPTATASRAERCAYTLAGNEGVVGWVLDVTAGSTFTLAATDENADLQDLDIGFYTHLSACAAGQTALEYANTDGDEGGTVPDGATVAIVYLFAGANASFAYTET